jgi:hypothetical protein
VDIARLDRVRTDAPLLLLQTLEDGRVLVDRDTLWPRLRSERSRLARSAREALENDRRQAAESLRMLLQDA